MVQAWRGREDQSSSVRLGPTDMATNIGGQSDNDFPSMAEDTSYFSSTVALDSYL